VGAGARGQLAAGHLALPQRLAHLAELQLEDVVEDEGGPLIRGEALEGEEQRERQILGQLRARAIGRQAGLVQHRLGQPGPHIALPARARRLELVQAQPGHHLVQEGAGLAHLGLVGGPPAQERVLDHVLGLAERAKHPVGQPGQRRPQPLELGDGRGVVGHQAAGFTARLASPTRTA
jgi:hypothetical protein